MNHKEMKALKINQIQLEAEDDGIQCTASQHFIKTAHGDITVHHTVNAPTVAEALVGLKKQAKVIMPLHKPEKDDE